MFGSASRMAARTAAVIVAGSPSTRIVEPVFGVAIQPSGT